MSETGGSPGSSPKPLLLSCVSPAISAIEHDSSLGRPSPFTPASPTSPCSSKLSTSCSKSSGSPGAPSPQKRKTKVFRSTAKRRLYSESSSEDEQLDVTPCDVNQEHHHHDHHSSFICAADPTDSSNSLNESETNNLSSSNSSSSSNGSSLASSSVEEITDSASDVYSECRSDSDNCSDSDCDNINYLFEGSDMTADEGLLEVLKIYVKECWTKKSLDKVIKLLKRMLPEPNEMPTSAKAALNCVYKLTASCTEMEFLYCEKCLQLWDKDSSKCLFCPGETYGKFYYFPLEYQIKHMFEQRNLAAMIDTYKEQSQRREGYISDIIDGSEYKRVRQKLIGEYDLVLLWNTDGVSLSKSSTVELWPVLSTICEIAPRLRASYLLVCGVYVGKVKPDMNVFLKPFSDSLIKAWNSKVSWVHPATKVSHCSVVVAPVVCADAPARASVQQIMNFNARFGCNTCEQKSKKCNEPMEVRNKNNEIVLRRKRVFLFQENSAALRQGRRMELQGELARLRKKPRKGVVGPAEISNIPLLNRAKCISAEYLHLVALGIVKSLLNIIIFIPGPWFIGDKLTEIDAFMGTISVPDYVKRLPGGFCDFKHWKGSEFRSFLLFYSLPVFKNCLPEKYFQHWLLLVQATFILLKDSISEVELQSAELMTSSFVRDIKTLYGENTYSYNLHTFLHVCKLVKRWGPLWATSAFMFENFNGFISAHLHGTKHLAKELLNNIRIAQGVTLLDNIVNAPNIAFRSSRSQIPTSCGTPVQFDKLSVEEKSVLNNANFGAFLLYDRAKIEGEIYTSKNYDSGKKRVNSYIQFQTPEGRTLYGQVAVFIKYENGNMFVLVNVLKLDHINFFVHFEGHFMIKHLKPVNHSDELLLVSANFIVTKVLKIGMYLGIRPNSLEINL